MKEDCVPATAEETGYELLRKLVANIQESDSRAPNFMEALNADRKDDKRDNPWGLQQKRTIVVATHATQIFEKDVVAIIQSDANELAYWNETVPTALCPDDSAILQELLKAGYKGGAHSDSKSLRLFL